MLYMYMCILKLSVNRNAYEELESIDKGRIQSLRLLSETKKK